MFSLYSKSVIVASVAVMMVVACFLSVPEYIVILCLRLYPLKSHYC